jgi:glycosyltransferase involved in cell wall biosynthesis
MSNTSENNARADLNGCNVLFIAYFYPPTASTGVPGSMRTVKFIRHLSGGQCHVLTTPPSVSDETNALSQLILPVNGEVIHRVKPLDVFKLLLGVRGTVKKLLGKQKPTSRVEAAPATATFKSTSNDSPAQQQSTFQKLKDFIYNLCYFPDQAGPWILPAYKNGKAIVKKNNIDVIFATGSPWSGLIAGYLISKSTGKPLIIDFRDPWLNNPFHQSKGKLLDSWTKALEQRIVKHAAAVSLNTEPLKNEFLRRYLYLPPQKFFVMPNGYDSTDFEQISAEPRQEDDSSMVLCHAGFLYGVRDPAALLDAIRIINSEQADQAGKCKLVFRQIGDVQLAYSLDNRYADLVENGSLILDAARSYQACLSSLKSADIVVNIQPATQSQIPSKLYDYLAINKPIVSLTPHQGALGQLIREEQFGFQADFNDQDALLKILRKISTAAVSDNFTGYENRNKFAIEEVARLLTQRINNTVKEKFQK